MSLKSYRFEFEQYIPKGRFNNLDKSMFQKALIKEYGVQLGDIFFEENTPVWVGIILEQQPPKSWGKSETFDAINGKKHMFDRGPEPEKVVDLILNALQGAAFVKRDQVCYYVFKKRYGKQNKIEIQIGEYQNGKN